MNIVLEKPHMSKTNTSDWSHRHCVINNLDDVNKNEKKRKKL